MFATGCLAVSIGVTAAVAATTAPDSSVRAASKDFAHLSIDGAHAFQDIGLARLAIFDGKPSIAVKLVADAQQAIGRARSDDTVFTKAEADLKPGKMATTGTGTGTGTGTDASAAPSTTKTAWVPIDGSVVLDETLAPTPEKTAAVAAANEHLRKGEPDKARDALKLASVTADYTLAVAPLKQSTTDIAKASTLLASKDYYGASQALRQAQDAVRYDTTVVQDSAAAPATASAPTAAAGGAPSKG